MQADWTIVGDEPLMNDRGMETVEVPSRREGGKKVHALCPVCGTRLRDIGRAEAESHGVTVCPNRLCRQIVRLKQVDGYDA